METIRVEATVREDGSLVVPELRVGEQVEVIVLRKGVPPGAKRLAG